MKSAMKQQCSICEDRPAYWWSPTMNAYYCARCYRKSSHYEENDIETSTLKSLAKLTQEHKMLLEAHGRLVLLAWDSVGDEQMIKALCGLRWGHHFQRTIEQIQGQPERPDCQVCDGRGNYWRLRKDGERDKRFQFPIACPYCSDE